MSDGRTVVSLTDRELASLVSTAVGVDKPILESELVSRFRGASLTLTASSASGTLKASKIKFEKPLLFLGKPAELPNWIFVTT